MSDLQGLYFFSDYGGSRIWSIPGTGATVTASQRIDWSTAFTPNVGSISSVVSFGEDNAGNLFLVDYNGGEVFRSCPSRRRGCSPRRGDDRGGEVAHWQ